MKNSEKHNWCFFIEHLHSLWNRANQILLIRIFATTCYDFKWVNLLATKEKNEMYKTNLIPNVHATRFFDSHPRIKKKINSFLFNLF